MGELIYLLKPEDKKKRNKDYQKLTKKIVKLLEIMPNISCVVIGYRRAYWKYSKVDGRFQLVGTNESSKIQSRIKQMESEEGVLLIEQETSLIVNEKTVRTVKALKVSKKRIEWLDKSDLEKFLGLFTMSFSKTIGASWNKEEIFSEE